MKTAVLKRTSKSDDGTFGTISIWKISLRTGELPWRSNDAGLSCIPAGNYRCEWTYSPRLKRKTYELKGVFKRADIRIHSANYVGDRTRNNPNTNAKYLCEVEGCIALGKMVGPMMGQESVMRSRDAISSFETYMAGEEFMLEIRDEILQAPRV